MDTAREEHASVLHTHRSGNATIGSARGEFLLTHRSIGGNASVMPLEITSAREEIIHTHRGSTPLRSSSAITVAARPVHQESQRTPLLAHNALLPRAMCFGGSASAPSCVAHPLRSTSASAAVPARPAQILQSPHQAPPTPSCDTPQPQASFSPMLHAQHSPLGDTFPPMLPTVPVVHPGQVPGTTAKTVFPTIVADPRQVPVQPDAGDDEQLSPRDSVWKRYFSTNSNSSSLTTLPPGEQPAACNDGLQVLTVGTPHLSPADVPRLLLQSAAVHVCRYDSGSAPTECNELPLTERSHPLPATERAHPNHRAGPSRFPSQTVVAAAPSLRQQSAPLRTPEFAAMRELGHESVRLSEVDWRLHQSTAEAPPWRTGSMPSAWNPVVDELKTTTETNGSASTAALGTNGSLVNLMGQFGLPDAPVAIDMAHFLLQSSLPQQPQPQQPILQQPLLQTTLPPCSVPRDLSPQPPDTCADYTPKSQSVEYAAQSFIMMTSPSRRGQQESFSQSAGIAKAPSEQAFAQMIDLPTPLRSHSTFQAFTSSGATPDPKEVAYGRGELQRLGQDVPEHGYGCLDLQRRGPLSDGEICNLPRSGADLQRLPSSGMENVPPLQSQVHDSQAAGEQCPPEKHSARRDHGGTTEQNHRQRSQERPVVIRELSSARTCNRKEAEEELDAVTTAASAVNLRDLAELRSFRNPPALVCQVLEPLAVLLGVTDTRWVKMRKLLDGSLLGKLISFDPNKLTQQQVARVEVLLHAPAFTDGTLDEKCPAAFSLAVWCDAIIQAARSERVSPAGPVFDVDVHTVDAPSHAMLGGILCEPNVWAMTEAELAAVRNLRFTREGVGSILFHGETDLRDVLPNLANVVILQPGEVVVYPNPGSKPPIGVGLNKAADITLFDCMPKTQGFRDQKAKERYRRRVRQMTEDKGAEFVDYDCTVGTWRFRVNHF